MNAVHQTRNPERMTSALIVAALHVLIGYAFLTGLAFDVTRASGDGLKLFDVPAPPPPIEEARPAAARTPDPEGAAAPPNLKADPAPIVAPKPEIVLPILPPIVAAPVAGLGNAPSAGASDRAGPGTGAGGDGSGTGSGRAGRGTGGGGGVAVGARQISGRIVDADYPRAARRTRIEGTVRVHFTVGADGRAGGCRVVITSGNAELDATTCSLIERRFRFEPARDAEGRPVPEVKGWEQVWWLE